MSDWVQGLSVLRKDGIQTRPWREAKILQSVNLYWAFKRNGSESPGGGHHPSRKGHTVLCGRRKGLQRWTWNERKEVSQLAEFVGKVIASSKGHSMPKTRVWLSPRGFERMACTPPIPATGLLSLVKRTSWRRNGHWIWRVRAQKHKKGMIQVKSLWEEVKGPNAGATLPR